MSVPTRSIEDAPMTPFLWKVTAFTTGGMFCDGYMLGNIGIALTLAQPALGLSGWMVGAIGAAALAGIFFGSLIVGWITDRIGRQRAFLIDLVVLLIVSGAQYFVEDGTQLLILRLIMGVAIGADYAIGAALLAEVAPRRHRGVMLGSLNAVWVVGFVGAFLVAYWMRETGWSWQAILATSALPVAVVLLLRIGAPESPRWLLSQGRTEEALKVIEDHWGPDYGLENLGEPMTQKASYRELFSDAYARRTIFAGVFWCCQVLPVFALTIFLPQVLMALNVEEELAASLLVNGMFLVGSVLGLYLIKALPRRGFVIWSFGAMVPLLLLMGLGDYLSPAIAVGAFALFILVAVAASDLEYVYPSELFPTHLRASGVGLAAAISRIGAAMSTFLLPVTLDRLGATWTMSGLAVVAVIGLVVSVAWAPETKDMDLLDASRPPRDGAMRTATTRGGF